MRKSVTLTAILGLVVAAVTTSACVDGDPELVRVHVTTEALTGDLGATDFEIPASAQPTTFQATVTVDSGGDPINPARVDIAAIRDGATLAEITYNRPTPPGFVDGDVLTGSTTLGALGAGMLVNVVIDVIKGGGAPGGGAIVDVNFETLPTIDAWTITPASPFLGDITVRFTAKVTWPDSPGAVTVRFFNLDGTPAGASGATLSTSDGTTYEGQLGSPSTPGDYLLRISAAPSGSSNATEDEVEVTVAN